jgi:hypothetical protein
MNPQFLKWLMAPPKFPESRYRTYSREFQKARIAFLVGNFEKGHSTPVLFAFEAFDKKTAPARGGRTGACPFGGT